MINWGLRTSQIRIEDRKRMNIVQRSAEDFRCARNSESPRGECEVIEQRPKVAIGLHTYLSIDKKALELQKRLVSLEEEVRGGVKKEVYIIK